MPDKLDNIKLRSEEVQDILTKVPHWMIRYGNTLFFLLILLILFLAWFIKYPDIVQAEATLTTEIPPQKEYAKTTGKLAHILVEDGTQVMPNQILAVIENTADFKDVYLLKSIIDTLHVKNNEFHFPIQRMPLLFLGEIETDYAIFENNYLDYKLNKELDPYGGALQSNSISLQTLKYRLENLKAQQELNESELTFKEKDLKRNKALFEKGVISAQEYETKQLEFLAAKRNFKNITASIHQLKEAMNNTRQTSRSTTIDMKRDEAMLLKKTIQSFHQLQRSIKDWEFRYILKSTIKGKVSFLNYWSTNQTVNQGDWVFTIIPQEKSSYLAKLKTPIQNSGKVKIGQPVNIRLENYPSEEFGVLQGKVKHISTLPDKEGFYIIDAELPNKLITSYQKELTFKPDMKGVAEIITEDLRLIERFFYQFRKLLER